MIPERIVPGTLDWDLYQYEHFQRYEFASNYCKGKRILDAACGVGYGCQILVNLGAECLTGVDISENAIMYAQTHYKNSKITFEQSNVEELNLPDRSFDVAISFETVEHVKSPEKFFTEVSRILIPGGMFICSTPNYEFLYEGVKLTNPYHISEMKFHEFVSLFETKFDLIEQFYQTHSDTYLRYLNLLNFYEEVAKAFRFSQCVRLENTIRKWLRKETLTIPLISPSARRACKGDYIIEKLDEPKNYHLTFILVGKTHIHANEQL